MEDLKIYIEPSDKFIQNEKEVYEVTLEEIKKIAYFAVMLKPIPDVKKAYAYTNALQNFFDTNSNNLIDSYNKLVSSINGHAILYASIELLLLENKLAKLNNNSKNIDRTVDEYLSCQARWEELLDKNKSKYDERENTESKSFRKNSGKRK